MKHPLESFGYCPRCGSSGLEHVHGRAIHCAACELTYFHNVAAAVACFVRDAAGRLLVVRRGREPAWTSLGASSIPWRPSMRPWRASYVRRRGWSR